MEVKSIILILVASTIDISAGFDIIQKSHSDYYDITSIYKIQSDHNKKGCKQNVFNYSRDPKCYDVEVYLKTNAIGMPLEFNGLILSSNKNSLEFRADRAYPYHIITNNIVEYDVDEWEIATLSMSNLYTFSSPLDYNLLLWKSNNSEESFKIKWKQKNTIQTCISISYLLEDVSKCTLSMEIINQNNSDTVLSYHFQQTKALKTVLFKSSELLLKNIIYSLNLKLKKTGKSVNPYTTSGYYYMYLSTSTYTPETVYRSGCKIGIKRIAQCADEYENEELYTMTTGELNQKPDAERAFGVYPFGKMPLEIPLSSKRYLYPSTCLNGGFLYNNQCVCPPGFKGNICEYACGPNTFGVDCSGMCSMHRTGCQKMVFCTKDFGCKCPSGFSGDNCETKCTNGNYGVNCAQRCSKSCNSEICDIYTGSCTEGCKQNYIPPDCVEKYPWLNEPPKLESSDFYSIKLKLNFNPENISGSKTNSPVYYQIIYKLANNESEYQYTKLKEIEQQKSVTEIIDNVKPESSYSFGVILISEDGNANFDDIKTVNYSTLCRLTTDIDYGVNLLSGTDHINVTWNKHNNQNEDECKITGYLVKLIFNGTDIKQKSYSEEIISNNDNEYTFENFLSGQKYAVEVTAISAAGQATASEISYTSTPPYGFVKIQNIKAEFLSNQSAMVITWDTDNKYKMPMIFIVKYKINKYFSCSHEIVKSNWTSLSVFNQTKSEISDIIPNTQYILQVVPTIEGHDYKDHENILFVKTPTSTPKLTPVIVENSSYVTNQTAYFNWTINKNECSKLNGLFLGYRVVLKNLLEDTQIVNITERGTIDYDGFDTTLNPNTKYKLQVYVMTNYGFNSEQVLSIPFQTKSKFLVPVDELTVYKKNLKRKSIGIRWSFPVDEYSVDAFIITVVNDQTGFGRQTIVEPEKCIAWPTFYCATFENLIPNVEYTIKVKAKSFDYPTGGSITSVVSNFNDGFSDKPENLKATNVSSTHITLEWDIPWMINGVLKSFIINTEEISSKDTDECCESKPDVEIQVTEEMPTYNYTIYDLKPGSTYSIGVLSKTSLYGQTNRIHVTTLANTGRR